jgi:hypothetical protein
VQQSSSQCNIDLIDSDGFWNTTASMAIKIAKNERKLGEKKYTTIIVLAATAFFI